MFLRHTGGRLAAAYLIITVVLVMIPKPDIPETASGASFSDGPTNSSSGMEEIYPDRFSQSSYFGAVGGC